MRDFPEGNLNVIFWRDGDEIAEFRRTPDQGLVEMAYIQSSGGDPEIRAVTIQNLDPIGIGIDEILYAPMCPMMVSELRRVRPLRCGSRPARRPARRSRQSGPWRGRCRAGAALWVTISTGALLALMAVLAHLVDRDAGLAQAGGDLGQRAGFVEQRHAQVIGRGRGGWRRCGVRRGWRRAGRRSAAGRRAQCRSRRPSRRWRSGPCPRRGRAARSGRRSRLPAPPCWCRPATGPSGLSAGTRQGVIRCSSPRPVICATPSSLMR